MLVAAFKIAARHGVDVAPVADPILAFRYFSKEQMDVVEEQVNTYLTAAKEGLFTDKERAKAYLWAERIRSAMDEIQRLANPEKKEICLRDWHRSDETACPPAMPQLCAFGYECASSAIQCAKYQFISGLETIGAPLYLLGWLTANPTFVGASRVAGTGSFFLKHKALFFEYASISQQVQDDLEVKGKLDKETATKVASLAWLGWFVKQGMNVYQNLLWIRGNVPGNPVMGMTMYDWYSRWGGYVWRYLSGGLERACTLLKEHLLSHFLTATFDEQQDNTQEQQERDGEGEGEEEPETDKETEEERKRRGSFWAKLFSRKECDYTGRPETPLDEACELTGLVQAKQDIIRVEKRVQERKEKRRRKKRGRRGKKRDGR
ncbi:unnamed protein product [Vitrella brassicaformis CCMP3155]|uniref:Uncharacterized protein n=1 Tax=Vitrella brassicaformis (strain CCMP3155) TaxID=1169540 RepID=A0A0G4G203_VITBC|nr:unnamed protein product [Vitrella brassicaformis CCMP3155]|eukprot:CEM21767.1 unnamed protein product [Vitrella brassicaformis CCMP3155]